MTPAERMRLIRRLRALSRRLQETRPAIHASKETR